MRGVFVKSRNPYILTNRKIYEQYLIKEQGWEEEEVKKMTTEELKEDYEFYKNGCPL